VKRIAILHYASPPGIGGVESTIAYQARTLMDLGYRVRIISGKGEAFDDRIETLIHPLLGSSHPDILRVKAELDSGSVTPAFWEQVDRIRHILQAALTECDVCIAHNVLTLHKNLPLTFALLSRNGATGPRLIGWCNDIAWTNTQYMAELHSGTPWDVLRQPWPNVQYVTISEARQEELADLFGIPASRIPVIHPGIDIQRFFRWTPSMASLVADFQLLAADGRLLYPTRITRRKNIELGLHILDALRYTTGRDYRLIITGPPGPHNPGNSSYLDELLALRRKLNLDHAAHFLYEHSADNTPFIPDDTTITNLYELSDALLFPTTQEGFGIPILEAGLVGLPVFCTDIPPLRHTGQNDVYYFDPQVDSVEAVARQITHTLESLPTSRLRERVRRQYRWEALLKERLVPLLEAQ